MAVHVPATIVPGKLELLQAWVPDQPWLDGADASVLTQLGSYRFDDPDGEVGMETHLLSTPDGTVLQVPLTYRGEPQGAGGAALVTTMTHTALGDRWIYDGCTDPVYVAALATAILTGGREADLFMSTDVGLVLQPSATHVRGNGSSSPGVPPPEDLVVTHDGSTTQMRGRLVVTLLRTPADSTGAATLTGTWPGQATPLLLATLG